MKPSRPLIHALAALALLGSAAAPAQGIWRCGPQGNSFSDRPCADGQALSPAPAPSAVAVQQAAEVARRDSALATRLRAERLAQEQQFQRLQADLHRAQHQARRKDSSAAKGPSKGQERRRAEAPATHPPLRVAAGPSALKPRAERAQSATADVRTSAAAAGESPSRRD